MARARWFDPLLTFLHDQSVETEMVTLTLVEVVTIVGQPLPRSAEARTYWWNRQPGSMGQHLDAIGWRVVRARRPDEDLTITFVRASPDTTG